ncbi:hypothetical protein D3C81_491310 [compost metagenome]
MSHSKFMVLLMRLGVVITKEFYYLFVTKVLRFFLSSEVVLPVSPIFVIVFGSDEQALVPEFVI